MFHTTDSSDGRNAAEEGLPVPGAAPWRWFPVLTPLRLAETGHSALPYLPDGQDWIDLARRMTTNFYLEAPGVGWLLVENIRPGAVAEIHMGRLGSSSMREAIEAAPYLLQAIMQEYDLRYLLAFVPNHLPDAQDLAKSVGFLPVGILPLYASYGGEFRTITIFTLPRKDGG